MSAETVRRVDSVLEVMLLRSRLFYLPSFALTKQDYDCMQRQWYMSVLFQLWFFNLSFSNTCDLSVTVTVIVFQFLFLFRFCIKFA